MSRVFANCAGLFSAAMEHAWLMQDPSSDALANDRAQFLSLLDAVGAGRDPMALRRRIEAKAAQATLLRDAAFSTDTARAERSRRRAHSQMATCRLLLLDS